MRMKTLLALPLLAAVLMGSAVGDERFRLVPTERPTPRSCIEVEKRGEGKVVAFYDENGTIIKEIVHTSGCNWPVVSKNRQLGRAGIVLLHSWSGVVVQPVSAIDILPMTHAHHPHLQLVVLD